MGINSVGIIVRSTQLYPDSPVLANIGEISFLEYLLKKIAKKFESETKIFAMAFEDLQEVSQEAIQLVENCGFHFFMGDLDYFPRMISAARHYGLEHVVDVKATCPLVDLNIMEGMISHHLSEGGDVTFCQNIPDNIVPIVSRLDALVRAKHLKNGGFINYYGLADSFVAAKDYQRFMAANPQYFNINLFEGRYEWQGEIDLFSENFISLFLQKNNLSEIRNVIYVTNKDDVSINDIINAKLIKNMKSAWDQPNTFNTNYIVADQAAMSSPEGYLKESEKEARWFVLGDKKYLNGNNISNMNILDVGCGHGRLIRVLSEHFGQVYGTDASAERYLEARYRCRQYDNINVTRNDGRSLSQYHNGQFDFTFAHGVFVHINSKSIINNYISEMARVLKKSGRLKFDCYYGEDIYGISSNNFGIGARFVEDEIKDLFSECGLHLINIEHVETRQFSRSGTAYSMPIKQLLVIGEKG